jgi:hypothetical protein
MRRPTVKPTAVASAEEAYVCLMDARGRLCLAKELLKASGYSGAADAVEKIITRSDTWTRKLIAEINLAKAKGARA